MQSGRPSHQAVFRGESRGRAAGGADARLPAESGGWAGAGGWGDSDFLAVPNQSGVDLSGGVVAAMSAACGSSLDEQTEPLVVVVLGPTGSGKTALSLALAERFNGEIVSCDSVAVYRGMELGTAKPTLAERKRVPHHLIDVTTPDVPFTAGEYSRQARAALKDISARGLLPIVTGGTGLYLRALTEGLFAGPGRQEGLRARLTRSRERHGDGWLPRLLRRLDPGSAARIHANDAAKLMRAIEVCLAGRRP